MKRASTHHTALPVALAVALILSTAHAWAAGNRSEGNKKTPGSLSGTVYELTNGDMSTTPIAGALVVAIRFNNAADPYGNPSRPIAMTETDGNGEWSIPELPNGNFLVTAYAPGYLLDRSPRLHVKHETHQTLAHYLQKVETTPSDTPGTLTGQVFHLRKPYWDDDVDDDDDWDDDDNDDSSAGRIAATLSRPDDHPTTGQVFEPIAGAYVTTFAFEMDDDHVEVDLLPVTGQARTNEDGRFTIHPLDPGLHMILVQALNHRPTVDLADISSTQTTEAMLLVVRAGDNPTTFPTVQWLRIKRPGDHHGADWFKQAAPIFTPPLMGQRNGWLVLKARNNQDTFGYWQSVHDWIHRLPDSLYQVNFVVATDQADPALSPGVRLRANSSSLMQTDISRISSLGDAGMAPTLEGRAYDLFFEPMDTHVFLPRGQDRINISFDILNFDTMDAPEGEVILKSIDVDVHSLGMLETVGGLGEWNFDAGPEGWQAHSVVPPFDVVTAQWEDGALALRVENQGNSFGYWSSPDGAFAAPEAGALVRATFHVRSNQGDPSEAATLRVRVNSADGQLAVLKTVPSLDEGLNSPDTDGRAYPVYLRIPPALAGQPLVFSIDVMGFDPDDADDNALFLEKVEVDKVQLPVE